MRAARADGAIDLAWDDPRTDGGFIQRVSLRDLERLAAFLGETPLSVRIAMVQDKFGALRDRFPVLEDVMGRWAQLRKVRTLGPESLDDWLDAARVIDHCRATVAADAPGRPIREASARLFNDSKRIEKLAGPVDVLLSDDLEAQIRTESDVWQELGLFREEHPARMAGRVMVERERVTSYLDVPYSGLPAATVKRLASIPRLLMTIENQTTFHSAARRQCEDDVLLIYTAGMPTPAWRAMYVRLLKDVPPDIPVYHWGDIDEGGFRIAATLAQVASSVGHALLPWKMHPDDVPVDRRTKSTAGTLRRIRRYADAAGWRELGKEVEAAGFTVEQEALV